MAEKDKNHTINWELKSIRRDPWDLFTVLERWFDESPTLKNYFSKAYSFHQFADDRMRRRFTDEDKKHGSKWRDHTARRLLAVAAATRKLGKRLWDHQLDGERYDSWQLQNCPPAGGEWTPDFMPKGPTGKRCRSRACPWCWMRSYVFLKQVLSLKGDFPQPAQTRVTAGLGLGPNVSLTLFERCGGEMMVPGNIEDFRLEADRLFRKAKNKPPFAVKTLVPVHFGSEYGIRIAYFYDKQYSVELSNLSLGRCASWDGIEVGDALRRGMPYMSWFLEEFVDEKHNVIETQTASHLYRIHRFLLSLKGKNLFSTVRI